MGFLANSDYIFNFLFNYKDCYVEGTLHDCVYNM